MNTTEWICSTLFLGFTIFSSYFNFYNRKHIEDKYLKDRIKRLPSYYKFKEDYIKYMKKVLFIFGCLNLFFGPCIIWSIQAEKTILRSFIFLIAGQLHCVDIPIVRLIVERKNKIKQARG